MNTTESLCNAPESEEPEDRGNPLDAVSRDAEPRDDSGDESAQSLANDLAMEFMGESINPESAPDILLYLAERGMSVHRKKSGADVNYESLQQLQHYKHIANLLIKIMYRLKEKICNGAHPSLAMEIYAALYSPGVPEFDAVNCQLNPTQFAKTVIIRHSIKRDDRGLYQDLVPEIYEQRTRYNSLYWFYNCVERREALVKAIDMLENPNWFVKILNYAKKLLRIKS